MPHPDADSFFPGVRKAVRLAKWTPLADSAGSKRLKLNLTIPLADGQLIGIPDWLTDAIKLVQNVEEGQEKTVSIVELDGATIHCYPNDSTENAALSLSGLLMKNFIIRRTSKQKQSSGDVCDVQLDFVIYSSWNRKLHDFCWTYFNNTFFAGFSSSQAVLTYGPPKTSEDAPATDPVVKGSEDLLTQPGETDEEARRRATSAAADYLFDKKSAASGEKQEPDPPKQIAIVPSKNAPKKKPNDSTAVN